MDIFDQASETEEYYREISIAAHRAKAVPLPAVGYCHYCEEQLKIGHRFCDTDCRDDYDREHKHLNRMGGLAPRVFA